MSFTIKGTISGKDTSSATPSDFFIDGNEECIKVYEQGNDSITIIVPNTGIVPWEGSSTKTYPHTLNCYPAFKIFHDNMGESYWMEGPTFFFQFDQGATINAWTDNSNLYVKFIVDRPNGSAGETITINYKYYIFANKLE